MDILRGRNRLSDIFMDTVCRRYDCCPSYDYWGGIIDTDAELEHSNPNCCYCNVRRGMRLLWYSLDPDDPVIREFSYE